MWVANGKECLKTMLINLSNNPSQQWPEPQKVKARDKYGLVQDLIFPKVPINSSKSDIDKIAESLFNQIIIIFDECANDVKQNAVLINTDSDISRVLIGYLLESDIGVIPNVET